MVRQNLKKRSNLNIQNPREGLFKTNGKMNKGRIFETCRVTRYNKLLFVV